MGRTTEVRLEALKEFRCHDFSDLPRVEDAYLYVTGVCGEHYSPCSAGSGRLKDVPRMMRHTPAYIDYLANVLKAAQTWPFPPLWGSVSNQELWDGHHRAQAALQANWDKPIPIRDYSLGW